MNVAIGINLLNFESRQATFCVYFNGRGNPTLAWKGRGTKSLVTITCMNGIISRLLFLLQSIRYMMLSMDISYDQKSQNNRLLPYKCSVQRKDTKTTSLCKTGHPPIARVITFSSFCTDLTTRLFCRGVARQQMTARTHAVSFRNLLRTLSCKANSSVGPSIINAQPSWGWFIMELVGILRSFMLCLFLRRTSPVISSKMLSISFSQSPCWRKAASGWA